MFPQVEGLLKQFVCVSLYEDDRQNPERSRRYQLLQQQTYGSAALPFYVIASPEGETLATFSGHTRNKAEFEEFLKKGLQPRAGK